MALNLDTITKKDMKKVIVYNDCYSTTIEMKVEQAIAYCNYVNSLHGNVSAEIL